MNEFDELRKLFREEEPVRPEAEPRAAAIAEGGHGRTLR